NGRLQVLNDEQALRGSLDSFKIQLGMPPTIGLELDDSPIRPITEQLARFQAVIDQYRATSDMIEEKYKSPDDALKLRERLKASATDSALVKGTAFRERVLDKWGSWERLTNDQLTKRVAELREQRRKLLAEKTRIEGQNQPIPPTLVDQIYAVESELRYGVLE